MNIPFNVITVCIPVAFIFIGYFIRIETRLTKISNDIHWIKKIHEVEIQYREDKGR